MSVLLTFFWNGVYHLASFSKLLNSTWKSCINTSEVLAYANVNGCNVASLGDYGVLERDCISRLKSYGQALEQEYCFPDVLCDGGDTSADLLCLLYGHVMPRTRCLSSNYVEDMGVG